VETRVAWFKTPTFAVVLVLAASVTSLLFFFNERPALVPQDLPPAERQLVEFLLLLPLAALICCVIRTVIGLHTFGTFAPALLGLSFREVQSLAGVFILIVVLSVGWMTRRGLAQLNLLQVSRSAVLLSVAVMLLLAYVLLSNHRGNPVSGAIPFLPLVIVTALVERFWTMEEEDGTSAALRTMAATLLTSLTVFLFVRWEFIVRSMIDNPELLGLVVAAQITLGRYTGFRLVELYRFRDLAKDQP